MNQADLDPATTHRKAAEKYLEECSGTGPDAAQHLAAAQVHATLAAAAEWRTANLLAADAAGHSTQKRGLGEVVRGRLGLDTL